VLEGSSKRRKIAHHATHGEMPSPRCSTPIGYGAKGPLAAFVLLVWRGSKEVRTAKYLENNVELP
jgi:hypothetical protein